MKSNYFCYGLYALVFMLATLTIPAYAAPPLAQDEKTANAPTVDDQVRDLTAKLNLTQEQQVKVREILDAQQRQAQDAMGGNTLSREDKLSQVRRANVATNSKIRELLNDDQKAKFDQMEKERAAQQASGQQSQK